MTGQKGGFMEGTISKNDAYNTLTEYYHHTTEIQHKALREALERVPDSQPERLTDDDFETIRIHLNAYKEKLCNQHRWEEANEYQRIIDRFMAFASAQPETHDKRTKTHSCDCISRQAAIDSICRTVCDNPEICESPCDEVKILENMPTAQPDLDEIYAHAETEAEARFHCEIVRCMDCKYNSNTCGNYVNCDIIPQMFGRTTDNFCSIAERRTDG